MTECRRSTCLFLFLVASAGAEEIRLTGHVRQQFTGLPVPGATVHILGTIENKPVERRTSAGPDGSFSVEAPAGEYIVIAAADGYDAARQGGIILTPGKALPALDLSLLGLSSLNGRVIDSRTKGPLAGATIQAFLLTYLKGQRQRWFARKATTTGDNGEFFIERLPAGEYSIEIEPQQKREMRDDGATIGYSRQVWPGPIQTTSPLMLRPNAEHALGNIAVERTVLPVLDIRLTGACVQDANYTVTVYETDQASRIQRATTPAGCDGRRSVTLSRGQYDVIVNRTPTGGFVNAASEVGAVTVFLTNASQEVQIPMFGPVAVKGSIGLSGAEAPRDLLAKLVVQLFPIGLRTSRQTSAVPFAVPSPIWPDRTFSTRIYPPPGRIVKLQISGLPRGHFVKEILYNGAAVDTYFELNVYAPAHEMRVTLSNAGGAFHGVAKDNNGRPVPAAAVVLTPWPMTVDANYPLDLVETRADSAGTFTFDTVRPGDYRVVGIPDGSRQRYEEPDRLGSAFSAVSTFTIKDGEVFTREIVTQKD